MVKIRKSRKDCAQFVRSANVQAGFSLVEVICALVIFLIVLLGLVTVFTYAVNYNSGNNSRAQALAVLQQEVELLRSAKFVPAAGKTDADLIGGTKPSRAPRNPPANGGSYKVQITVDDDPFCPGIQPEAAFCADSVLPVTLKEITVTVALDSPTPGWQTSVPAKVVLRRARSN
jgi:prepilin-type N-terminal cleavage/methylation domain-containing protein